MPFTKSSGPITIGNGNSYSLHRFNLTEQKQIVAVGVSKLDGSILTDLEIEVYNHTDGISTYSSTEDFNQGLSVSLSTGKDYEIRINNNSTSVLDVHAFIVIGITFISLLDSVTSTSLTSLKGNIYSSDSASTFAYISKFNIVPTLFDQAIGKSLFSNLRVIPDSGTGFSTLVLNMPYVKHLTTEGIGKKLQKVKDYNYTKYLDNRPTKWNIVLGEISGEELEDITGQDFIKLIRKIKKEKRIV